MDGKLSGLLVANITLAPIQRLAEAITPSLGTVLITVQILVGLATAYYFWRKARAVRVPKNRRKQ